VATFPVHFHNGEQEAIVASPFAPTLAQGFREFMAFVQRTMGQ
jgi:hypothetical protein